MPSTATMPVYAYDDVFLEHDMPGHPESAARLRACMAALLHSGLLSHLRRLSCAPASDADLLRVHEAGYLAWLRAEARAPTRLVTPDTYMGAGSYRAATYAVRATIGCVRAIAAGEARSALALVRPPGHHALPGRAMGFCLLNNVACAARYASQVLGIESILIVDVDVHHGNGTQEAFYEDPRVLYVSLHQNPLYPYSGSTSERGAGSAFGKTANLPLPPGTGDASWLACIETIVRPLAERFAPGICIVSLGFDGHWRDPISNAALQLTLPGYDAGLRALIALADDLCGGRIAFVLEGGYDLEVLGAGAANLAAALAGVCVPLQDPAGAPRGASIDGPDRAVALARQLGLSPPSRG